MRVTTNGGRLRGSICSRVGWEKTSSMKNHIFNMGFNLFLSVSGSVLEAPGLPGITLRLRLSVSGQRKKQNKIKYTPGDSSGRSGCRDAPPEVPWNEPVQTPRDMRRTRVAPGLWELVHAEQRHGCWYARDTQGPGDNFHSKIGRQMQERHETAPKTIRETLVGPLF